MCRACVYTMTWWRMCVCINCICMCCCCGLWYAHKSNGHMALRTSLGWSMAWKRVAAINRWKWHRCSFILASPSLRLVLVYTAILRHFQRLFAATLLQAIHVMKVVEINRKISHYSDRVTDWIATLLQPCWGRKKTKSEIFGKLFFWLMFMEKVQYLVYFDRSW